MFHFPSKENRVLFYFLISADLSSLTHSLIKSKKKHNLCLCHCVIPKVSTIFFLFGKLPDVTLVLNNMNSK